MRCGNDVVHSVLSPDSGVVAPTVDYRMPNGQWNRTPARLFDHFEPPTPLLLF